MKITITVFFSFLALTSWSQINKIDSSDAVKQSFWNDNIAAIIHLDKEKIIEQTNFPLKGEWYQEFELWEASEAQLKAAYIDKIEKVFDELVIIGLKKLTWKNASFKLIDGEYGISVIYDRVELEDHNFIYFSYELVFKKINNHWMLTEINFIG
ncbi:MAG: hypothetical protein HXX09_11815 [Bacteroidetes bacterium]|nr:hypothetical protein [Bacteroidota bacterium]